METGKWIAECNLDGWEGKQYLLLDTPDSDGQSGLDIILEDGYAFWPLMYNCDYAVSNLKKVKQVSNLDELIDYMLSEYDIDLSQKVKNGEIEVGMGDMLPYDLNHYVIGEDGDPNL